MKAGGQEGEHLARTKRSSTRQRHHRNTQKVPPLFVVPRSGKVEGNSLTDQERTQRKQLPIEVVVPEELRDGIYANFMRAQFTEHEFILTFARLSPEDVTEEKALAKAVSRIIVPHHILPLIIAALSRTLSELKEMGELKTEVEIGKAQKAEK